MNKYVDFFKLISDEKRIRIFILLYKKELCVCKLQEILKTSQPNISKKLADMKKSGFLKSRKEGNYIYYSLHIEDKEIEEMFESIFKILLKEETIKEDLKRKSFCNKEKR